MLRIYYCACMCVVVWQWFWHMYNSWVIGS